MTSTNPYLEQIIDIVSGREKAHAPFIKQNPINLNETKRTGKLYKHFELDDMGILWLEGPAGSKRICVPRDPVLLERIMWELHDAPTKGHSDPTEIFLA